MTGRSWNVVRGAMVLASAALLAGCVSDGGGAPAAVAADDAGADGTLTVKVDHFPDEFPATFNHFFPSRISAAPGQVIEFVADFTGEPHDVALGTVVDDAVAAFRAIPEDQAGSVLPGYPLPGVTDEQQEAAAKLPQPRTPDMVDDIDDTTITVVPCYLEDEEPPVDDSCPPESRFVPDQPFDGTQTYYASQGLIETGETFRLELADDIAPGEYAFVCTLHASWMHGTITVVDEGGEADTPGSVAARAEAEIAALVDELQPVAEEILQSTGPEAMAGELGSDLPPPEVTLNVFPERISADVGEPVTWTFRGAHTITFNPGPELADIFTRGDDWLLRSNEVGNEATEGQPRQAAFPAFPRDAPPPPPPPAGAIPAAILDARSWDGQGFWNSGLLYSFYGQGIDYTMTFEEPGEYVYYCFRHPGMVGTVEVG